MSELNPYGHIKPTSDRFEEYLAEKTREWREAEIAPQTIQRAILAMRLLEKIRLCFSKPNDAAFKTKHIKNEALAKLMGYGGKSPSRCFQRIRKWLEEMGVLAVRRSKLNGFYNKWNQYELADFKNWFVKRYQQRPRQTRHPIKENNQRLFFQKAA